MTSRPIIYSAPMVRASWDGRKSNTRRLAWRPNGKPTVWQKVQPGDRLWVREAWAHYPIEIDNDLGDIWYRESGRTPPSTLYYHRWRSPIHMPRWASRMTQIVTAVKIERLQEISEADALAEGIDDGWLVKAKVPPPRAKAFRYLWEDLHGLGSWDANPFVVALTFETHNVNIDAMP